MWGIHNRCCCWAQFRDRKNGKTFYVFNSHFHVNAPDQKWPNGLPFTNQQAEEIRLKSARLLLDVINGKVKIEGNDVNVAYGEPVFITGESSAVMTLSAAMISSQARSPVTLYR